MLENGTSASRLHIAINALSAGEGGGASVARNLTREMGRLRPDHRFTFFYSDPLLDGSDFTPNVDEVFLHKLSRMGPRTFWENFRFPRFIRRESVDAILLLGGYSTFTSGCPQVSVWQNPGPISIDPYPLPRIFRAYVWLQRKAMQRSMHKAAQNVFLTQNSADMTSHWWKLDGLPYCVIHNGLDPEHIPESAVPEIDERDHFALSVGNFYAHKNYKALIEAMEYYKEHFDDGLRLVILGGPMRPKELFDDMRRMIRERDLEDTVSTPGAAPLDQVAKAMREAKVYVIASTLETFGLTLVEAMNYGLPILSSDHTCLPEVCGDAAIFFDPTKPEEIAEKLHQLAMDKALQQRLRNNGFERAKEFSWENAAQKYLHELERVAESRSSTSA